MPLADEIARLDELRAKGVLSDAEFQRAKERLIGGVPSAPPALDAVNRFRRSQTDRWIAAHAGDPAVARPHQPVA